jgi:hypothetical protein
MTTEADNRPLGDEASAKANDRIESLDDSESVVSGKELSDKRPCWWVAESGVALTGPGAARTSVRLAARPRSIVRTEARIRARAACSSTGDRTLP